MRYRAEFLGVFVLLVLALPAQAQFSIFSQKGTGTQANGAMSLFGGSMGKPNFSAIANKTPAPAPINFSSLMPSFPNFRDILLQRNSFSGGQTITVTPPPPPPKKK